jgi:hypothetical protein
MKSFPKKLIIAITLLSASAMLSAQSLTVSPSGTIRISPDNNDNNQGKASAPGQMKKSYGGSATDYAPGQQKKDDGGWTLNADDSNGKSKANSKGSKQKSKGKNQ